MGGAILGEGATGGATAFREASWDKGTAGAGGALFGKRALVVAGAAGGGETGVWGA